MSGTRGIHGTRALHSMRLTASRSTRSSGPRAILCALVLAMPIVLARGQTPTTCALPAEATQRLAEGALQVGWRAEPAALAVGRPFALTVWICPRDAQLAKVDATMPEHRHGMNYRTSIAPQEAGVWRVRGLLWHMPGRWELRFDVQAGAEAPRSLRQSVELR